MPVTGGLYCRGLYRFVECLFRGFSGSILDDCGATPLQLSFFPRRLTVIDFDRDQYKTFVAFAAAPFSLFAASHRRLINLNVFSKLNASLASPHRQLNFALEKPRRLLVNVKLTSQLARAQALLGGCQQVNHGESRGQRKFDFVEQGVRGGRFIESTRSTTPVMTSTTFYEVRASTATASESIAPFLVRQMRFARILSVELLHEFNECQLVFHSCLDLMLQSKTPTPQPISGVRSNR